MQMNLQAAGNAAGALTLSLREMGHSARLGLHLAIGMFDGVHLGHRSVILSAVNSARSDDATSGVLTFDPHPSRLFRPDKPTQMLMPVSFRLELLRKLGVEQACCQPFTREFAAIEASDFLAYLQQECPALKAVYVGENFRFGKGRSGDVPLLAQLGRKLGIAVFSAERIRMNTEPISSTRIRIAIQEGALREANTLLGYHYRVRGAVIPGQRLGRTIGFPTLNIAWQPECLPRFGVYYVRVRACAQAETPWLPAIANYGLRPSIAGADKTPLLECHVLQPTDLDQGAELEVEWLDFIRAEQHFDGLDALKSAIARDKHALMQQLGLA